ncbi:HPF/RaiA family ribosome-associated protein [Halopseudomonas salegens]|uniref:Sigma 54 modulation protein / S30EA ribosomal protein n=1 Tax=Halopseudomonas salegens TaxID=1434072 RepID=A0A1H2EUS6_9GAMM|nr:HPF/RaiA family ribosome-associated protein [Halopseudomonas salegens]SDT98916.1 Sigma 54 modulation protein / S30EA ribosomal protein [Halopseudomonas salegens]
MQIQVNSKHTNGSVRQQEWVSATLQGELKRFDEFLTRVEVHLSDENAHKSGADDKRCQIELRPKGHQALSVTHKASSLEQAVNGAAEKAYNALEHLMGKLNSKHNGVSSNQNEVASAERDALLQEEFLDKQTELDHS